MPGFQFSFDSTQCLNCGVCVDVCPVRCLDMSRPTQVGPEPTDTAPDPLHAWMTIFPVQIGRCTGCMVCVMECPTDIISVMKVEGEVAVAPPQGELVPEVAYHPNEWQALSDFTRVSRKKRTLGDPWGDAPKWLPVRRQGTWRVWRTWRTHEDYAGSAAESTTTREE